MEQQTQTNQPPPPPSQAPTDIFESDADQDNVINSSKSAYAAIDLGAVNAQLEQFIEYVQETRSDLEAGGTAQGWIDQLFSSLKETLSAVRMFEIDHAEDAIQREEAYGRISEVILREQDPAGFDRISSLFETSSVAFQEYFQKHREVKIGTQQ